MRTGSLVILSFFALAFVEIHGGQWCQMLIAMSPRQTPRWRPASDRPQVATTRRGPRSRIEAIPCPSANAAKKKLPKNNISASVAGPRSGLPRNNAASGQSAKNRTSQPMAASATLKAACRLPARAWLGLDPPSCKDWSRHGAHTISSSQRVRQNAHIILPHRWHLATAALSTCTAHGPRSTTGARWRSFSNSGKRQVGQRAPILSSGSRKTSRQ
jgi:hypothetical protein